MARTLQSHLLAIVDASRRSPIARLRTVRVAFRNAAARARNPTHRSVTNATFTSGLRTRSSRLFSSAGSPQCPHTVPVFSARHPTSCRIVACASQFYIIRGISFVCRMSIQNLNTFGKYEMTRTRCRPPRRPHRCALVLRERGRRDGHHRTSRGSVKMAVSRRSPIRPFSHRSNRRVAQSADADHGILFFSLPIPSQTPLQMQSRVQMMTSRTVSCI